MSSSVVLSKLPRLLLESILIQLNRGTVKMSVYTNVIINFVGTENELKNVISPKFDEYDVYITKLFNDYYRFNHPECNIHELMATMEKVANHKKCKDIFSEVTWQYKG